MQGAGKLFLVGGLMMMAMGLALMFADRIPLVGKLPGDISFRRGNFEMHIPLVTCLLVSLLLNGILLLIAHVRNRP